MLMWKEMETGASGSGVELYESYSPTWDNTTKKLTIGFQPSWIMVVCKNSSGSPANAYATILWDKNDDPTKSYMWFNTTAYHDALNATYGLKSVESDGVILGSNHHSPAYVVAHA